jgi:hypothetical protein
LAPATAILSCTASATIAHRPIDDQQNLDSKGQKFSVKANRDAL